MRALSKPRKKQTIYLKLELHEWIKEQVERERFWNVSHAVEFALQKLIDSEKEEEK